jgi:DNA polymerase-1
MTILALDFMNAAHRARSGFKLGPAPVVFNFFRQFKSLVDKFNPTRIYVALEGRPVKRHEALTEYKANRVVEPDDPRAADLAKFFAQKDVIVDLLTRHFPVSVVRHPTSECDDTIANLVRTSSTAVEWVIVSSDSDFTQLLHDRPNLRLYNPVKDEFVQAPQDYDYCTWKALRGDSSDNIPGVAGVGDKTATKIASDPATLKEFITRPEVAPVFSRNYDLVRFMEWTPAEAEAMTSSTPERGWDVVKSVFEGYGFASIVKDVAWQKFVGSFDPLFDVRS